MKTVRGKKFLDLAEKVGDFDCTVLATCNPYKIRILDLLEDNPAGVFPEHVRDQFPSEQEARVRTAIIQLRDEGLVDVTPSRKLVLVVKE